MISGSVSLVERLEIFARLEADGAPRRDVDASAGARIAAYPGFAWPYREYPETAQLDAVAVGEGMLHCAKDRIDGRLRLVARQPRALHDTLDEILLDQAQTPFRVKGEPVSISDKPDGR